MYNAKETIMNSSDVDFMHSLTNFLQFSSLYVVLEPLKKNTSQRMPVNVITTNDLPNHESYKLFIQVFCVCVIILGGIGNILVLIVFSSRWSKLATYDLFIIVLSIGDLMEILILRSIQYHEISGGTFYTVGSTGCKIFYFLSSMSNYVSSLALTMISIDRFIAVKWPFKDRDKLCRFMIAVTLFIACSVATIYLTNDRVMLSEADGLCRMYVRNARELNIIAIVAVSIQNFIPLILMTSISIYIIYALHMNAKNARKRVTSGEMRERSKNLRGTTKILFAAIILFFICVTPNNIFYLMYVFNVRELPEKVHIVLTILMMSNSCVNPIIYGKLHTTFRKQTIKLFNEIHDVIFRLMSHLTCSAHSYSPTRESNRLQHNPKTLQCFECLKSYRRQHSTAESFLCERDEAAVKTPPPFKRCETEEMKLYVDEFIKDVQDGVLDETFFQKETVI